MRRPLHFESLEARQLMTVDFNPVIDQTVLVGSPMHVPIDVMTDSSGPVEVAVSSSDPSLIHAELLTNPKSLRLDVDDFGSMVFRLFPEEAPRAVGRIEELVRSGFYNRTPNQQIIFHRVIDRFVIQAGDPTGTGSGGSSLGPFDDQFDLHLQHNRSGVLSYAKSQDDTNDSQFFITDVPARHLDYNHSIFGQMIEGDAVRQTISRAPVGTADRPLTDIVIGEASIFDDLQNGLIRLVAKQSSGSAMITVSVRNALGESQTRTFVANAAPDPFNSGPFLNDMAVPAIAPGATIQVPLSAQDVEGDPVQFDSLPSGILAFQHTLDRAIGLLTITAPAVNSGTLELLVGVRPLTASNTSDVFDVQRLRFPIHVPPNAANDLVTTTFERSVIVNVLSNDSSADGSLVPGSVQIVTQPTDGSVRVLNDGRIEYSHSIATPQSISFQYRVSSQFGLASAPATVTIQIRSIHQNPVLPLDTNNNQELDPLDVLEMINSINRFGTRRLPLDRLPAEPFLDPNGDGTLNPLDVLEVINAINSLSSRGSGEGEGESSEFISTHSHPPRHIDYIFGSDGDEFGGISMGPIFLTDEPHPAHQPTHCHFSSSKNSGAFSNSIAMRTRTVVLQVTANPATVRETKQAVTGFKDSVNARERVLRIMACYIKFDGVDGESKDKGHKGWSDLGSCSQVIHRAGGGKTGVQRRGGNAQLEDIQCSKELDKSSNVLAESICKGKVYPKVEIVFTTDGTDAGREPYFTYELKNVMVTSYSVSGSPNGRPHESFSLNFEEIKVKYVSAGADGKKGSNVEYGWKVEEGESA